MTGDGKALGTKFGIAFSGKWVWKLKDYIDTNFMKLFHADYLFRDFKNMGYSQPVENNELFDDEKANIMNSVIHLKEKVNIIDS